MIFEVESFAGNTIANNPLKVFAQPSSRFEKPLFYFQIIVEGEANSSRVELLENQYGTYNYRLYRLGRGDGNNLLCEVVRQHRRIRSKFSYSKVYDVLIDECWQRYSEPLLVLEEAYKVGLSVNTRLSDYIWLALTEEEIRQELPRLIECDANNNWNDICAIQTYMAKCFGPGILCAWLIGYHEGATDAWDSRFADLGIALYDDFALPFGGAYVACLAALCKGRGHAVQDWTRKLRSILDTLHPGESGLHMAAWLCHLAVSLDRPDDSEAAQTFIETAGGISETSLLTPPAHCPIEANIREEYFRGNPVGRLSFSEFSNAAKRLHGGKEHDRSKIAFSAINHEGYIFDWADDILAALWASDMC